MSRVFPTMAMLLDGFIAGPDDDAQNPDPQNPAGIDGHGAPRACAERRVHVRWTS